MAETNKRHDKHGPNLDNAGLTSGSTHAKDLRGEREDRGRSTLEDIEQVDRGVPPLRDREAGTPEADAEA